MLYILYEVCIFYACHNCFIVHSHTECTLKHHMSIIILSFTILPLHYTTDYRLKTLSLAVEDVLQKWTSECATLFVSSDALLEALIAQVAPGSSQDHRFEGMKRSIDTFLLATKRITNPSIPLAVWSEGKAIPYNEYLALFSFAPAWLTCLPVAFQGIGVVHSIYSLQTRQSYENILSGAGGVQLPQNQIELLTAICLPDVTDIGRHSVYTIVLYYYTK